MTNLPPPPENKPEHLVQWGELKTDAIVFIRIVFNFGCMIIVNLIANSELVGEIELPLSWGLTATEFGFFLSLLVTLLNPLRRVIEHLKLIKDDLFPPALTPPPSVNKEVQP